MSLKVEITQEEFETRKSNGAVWICRSCKDNRNKIVLLKYDSSKTPTVNYHFCDDCVKLMGMCVPCNAKKLG